jgi:hypothetical protein
VTSQTSIDHSFSAVSRSNSSAIGEATTTKKSKALVASQEYADAYGRHVSFTESLAVPPRTSTTSSQPLVTAATATATDTAGSELIQRALAANLSKKKDLWRSGSDSATGVTSVTVPPLLAKAKLTFRDVMRTDS